MNEQVRSEDVGGGNAATHVGSVLRAEGLSKHFDQTVALQDAALTVGSGEVLALCGHNGSGKSTLIKILSGYHRPEPGGRLWINGEEISLPVDPSSTQSLGMAFVHQDLGICNELSVADNLRINQWSSELRRIRWRAERRECVAALRDFGLDADPDAPASQLEPTEKTLLAIVRALRTLQTGQLGLFVLDEPTTHLPLGETKRLFDAIATLQGQGHGVIFISHRLDEVLQVSDRVMVLRSGRVIATEPVANLTERGLAEAIVGRELTEQAFQHQVDSAREIALEARGLTGGRVSGLDLQLRAGEIVGVTGLAGGGFEDVPYLLYGAIPADAGTLEVDGRPATADHPRDSIALGMSLVPADRLRLAAAGTATVLENLTLPLLARFSRGPVLQLRRERAAAQSIVEQHAVLPPEPSAALGSLSGGNQQKVVLARALAAGPAILLLHEPAQGVDIEARSQIFAKIAAAAQEGMAVLIASTAHEDLARIADRVLVLSHGAVKRELGRDALSAHALEHACLAA